VEVVSLFVSLMSCQRICFGNSALKHATETGLRKFAGFGSLSSFGTLQTDISKGTTEAIFTRHVPGRKLKKRIPGALFL
jgi:hypothetical protein